MMSFTSNLKCDLGGNFMFENQEVNLENRKPLSCLCQIGMTFIFKSTKATRSG